MFPVDTSHSPHAKLCPVSLDAVTLSDSFWTPRLRAVREVTLPTQLAQLQQTGRLDNFRRAVGLLDTPRKGYVFDDSDVYKWLEAVYWSLTPLSLLEEGGQGGEVIPLILAAQQPDGYLNTAFMGDKADQRWTNIRDWHELYCAGHIIQAAVAAARTSPPAPLPTREGSLTSSPPLSRLVERGGRGGEVLESALHLADLICATFGLEAEGKRPTAPGHQEIEMALVELYRLTGDRKYLAQAQYFLDARGHGLIGGSPYHQDHKPYRDLDRHAGHAVRALYMNCGAADLYAETGDPTLLETLTRLWEHATSRQMYITGGFGARHSGESFGDDYELPNRRAYAETCAAIASVMWNYRMLLITGEARYADLLEHTLFNGVLPGFSLDGQGYFYVNPLSNDGDHQRQPWFSCACCPPNVARLLASLPGYFYSLSDDNALWLHLYADNTLTVTLPDGTPLTLEIRTEYPWQEDVTITVHSTGTFTLNLRLPGWCENPTLTTSFPHTRSPLSPSTYHPLTRTWSDGDTLTLHLPMPVRFLESHPAVVENTGRVALQRGPILYCLESADNPDLNLDELYFDPTQPPALDPRPDLLNGLTLLHLPAEHRSAPPEWSNTLYRPFQFTAHESLITHHSTLITAIPYYAWANRTPGQMRVWLKTTSSQFP